MLFPLRWLVAPIAASVVLGACAGGNAASRLAMAPTFDPKGQTKCGVTKSQERPLIVEWPSPDRLEIESKVRQGLVVVHYVGCEMSVLPRCSVAAKYSYQGATRKEDRVEMKDADELYANLPVGAAKLEGKLQRSGKLTVNMSLVGRFEADHPTVRTDELQGECAGATHFVYGVTVGAFEFYAGGEANVGGGAAFGSLGAGAHSEAERESLSKDGDGAACGKSTTSDSSPPEGCGAPIRLEVVPIAGSQATPPVPASATFNGPTTGRRLAADASTAKSSLIATYKTFKTKRNASDRAWTEAALATIQAWELFRVESMTSGTREALAPPFSDYGAEAEYALDDDGIRRDYESGTHTYAGASEEILGKWNQNGQLLKPGLYQMDARIAQRYDGLLEHIASTYPTSGWASVAIARQGTLFDSLRTRLFIAEAPQVTYVTVEQERLLKQLENSGRQNLQDQADELRAAVKEGWRKKKATELAAVDELMVKRYATAVALARKYKSRYEEVTYAITRLAYYTDIIGNATMRSYVAKARGADGQPLGYTDNMYIQLAQP